MVVLDKKTSGQNQNGLSTVIEAELRGAPTWATDGPLGAFHAINTISERGLHLAPTYQIIAAKIRSDPLGPKGCYVTRGEHLLVKDVRGILGKRYLNYVLDILNGGFTVWDPARIKAGADSGTGVTISLEGVTQVLDAVKRQDFNGLTQSLHGERMAFAGGYNAFLEASQAPGFLGAMDTTYVVVRPASAVRTLGRKVDPDSMLRRVDLDSMAVHPNLVIAAGGMANAEHYAQSVKVSHAKWEIGVRELNMGAYDYKHTNSGRIYTVCRYGDLNAFEVHHSCEDSHGLGVSTPAREMFYRNMQSLHGLEVRRK
ncbi:MAG: hypothetical protein Q7S65_01360 [Nanoarchaeota archaeon]|nr:hypothetical protein [Nanoarchaeota archaeon]